MVLAIIAIMKDYNNLLEQIKKNALKINDGHLASYIPELTNVDSKLYAMAITLVNGETFFIGDTDAIFTLQSTSKPFTYGQALEDLGEDYVHSRVGVEPSGEAFNSIIELEKKTHRPFNPMINSGAIAVANMITDKNGIDRTTRVINLFSDLAGRKLDYNHSVFESEKKTAHRNRAIAHLLRHFEVIGDDIEESLDLYFKQCSVNVNVKDLSYMAATLANNGVNPKTQKRIYKQENIHKMLSLMFSCGMYDTAGTWAFKVGIPSKSGVSGAIFGVIPNVMGIACYSPLIDDHGHSLKGVHSISELSEMLNLNIFQYKK
jgi:glutaminase